MGVQVPNPLLIPCVTWNKLFSISELLLLQWTGGHCGGRLVCSLPPSIHYPAFAFASPSLSCDFTPWLHDCGMWSWTPETDSRVVTWPKVSNGVSFKVLLEPLLSHSRAVLRVWRGPATKPSCSQMGLVVWEWASSETPCGGQLLSPMHEANHDFPLTGAN